MSSYSSVTGRRNKLYFYPIAETIEKKVLFGWSLCCSPTTLLVYGYIFYFILLCVTYNL